MIQMAATTTVQQTIVEDNKRGRVMSFYSITFMVMVTFGSARGILAQQHIGAPLTVFLGGICCIAGSIMFSRRLPALLEFVRLFYVRQGNIMEVGDGLQPANSIGLLSRVPSQGLAPPDNS